MKKQFLCLVLLGLLCSVGNVWGAEETLTWAFSGISTAVTDPSGITKTSSNPSSTIKSTMASSFSNVKTKADASMDGYSSRLQSTDGTYLGDKSNKKIKADQYVGASFTIPDGYVFKLKSVSFPFCAISTGINARLTISDGETEATPSDGSASSSGTATISYSDLSMTKELSGEVIVKIWFWMPGSTSTGKYAGLGDLAITGDLVALSSDPSISAENVGILASDEEGSIEYTIINPVDGGEVSAAKKGVADWLLTVGSGDSPIAFTTTANAGAERSATVTLTYTYNTSETVTKDVTITQAAKTYSITYSAGTGASGSIEAGVKSHGVAFTLSSERFTRAGYVQVGWATSDGGDKAYDLGGSYTTNADQTFYPVWKEVYTITYNLGEGTGTVPTESPKVEGEEFTLLGQGAMVAPANKYFIGWNDGTADYNEGDEYTMGDENVILTAQWASLPVATENHYKYSYKDAQHYVSSTYRNPRGGLTVSGDNQTIPNGNLCESLGGITSVAISGAKYDGKGDHMNSYIKIDKGGTAKVIITIASGYKGTLSLKANGYSKNAGISVSNSIKVSGEEGGVATIEDNFNTLVYTLYPGSHNVTCSSNNMYISELDIVTEEVASVSGTISATGWSTFSSAYPLDLSSISGGTAYVATSAAANLVTLTPTSAKVASGEGVMIKGTAGDSFTINTTSENADLAGTNFLVGCPVATVLSTNANHYVMVSNGGVAEFQCLAEHGATIPAGKAYLDLTSLGGAPDRMRIVEAENGATDIKNIEANEKAVKFIENGRILILRDGITYDALGRVIRK